jgi:hypothetical protein
MKQSPATITPRLTQRSTQDPTTEDDPMEAPVHATNPLPTSRREMLARCGTGLGLIGLAGVLGAERASGAEVAGAAPTGPLSPRRPHFAPRAKHVIHLYMNGGPSQVDTFDPKPALAKHAGQRPDSIKDLKTENGTGGLLPSPFKFKAYGESGLEVSEIFEHTGRCADDLCIIRSMHTNVPNHEPSMFMMNSGHVQSVRPSYGSWLLYGLGTENANLPGYVVLGPGLPVNGAANWSSRFLPGVLQGTHLNAGDPNSVLPNLRNPWLSASVQREQLDLLQQLNQEQVARTGTDPLLEARIASFEMAFRMQTAAPEAFDLARESAAVQSLYGLDKGGTDFARNCLLARRLVERGVRVVQVYYGNFQPWDTHSDNARQQERLAREVDPPIGALLQDLKRSGLLDETLVLWSGEFGRTPASQGTGRDHNHWGFSAWLAGGGVKGGTAYGATDEFGFKAVEKRVHVHDLHATMLHLMGLDHERLTHRYSGRDFRLTDVHGRVLTDILA